MDRNLAIKQHTGMLTTKHSWIISTLEDLVEIFEGEVPQKRLWILDVDGDGRVSL
jgi:endonuclease III